MARKVYISCVVAFGFLFVPALFHFGVVWMIAPSWAPLLELFFSQEWDGFTVFFGFVSVAYSGFYTILFYLFGRYTYMVFTRFTESNRFWLQVLVLGAFFSLSFPKILFGYGLVERTERVNTWDCLIAYSQR
jgi:hypothetical protein